MKVNGQEIPQKAVEYELNRLIHFYAQHGVPQDQIRASLETLKKRAEEQVIGTTLLFAEAARLDIPVSEQEIDESVKAMEEQAGGAQKLREILEKQGQNLVQLRNEIHRGRKVDKLVAKITGEAADPTPAEAEAYFNAHRAEFGKEAQVRCQHILVSSKSASAEDDLADDGASNEGVQKVREYAREEKSEVFVVCAQIEQEIAELDDDEKKMFLDDLGLKESGLEKLIKASYRILGLISYLTAGEPEVRAWTITKGTKAPQAAGKIHSDFERGFIRAEVVSYDDLIACGSHNAAKEKGLIRLEGKDYVVKDGDIMLFRFNV